MAEDFSATWREGADPVVAELSAAGFDGAVEIGRGGFGIVYRCNQVGLDRVVAVKVLTAGVNENRPRFVREEQAMGRLTGHPNIVTVLQIGETVGGHPFLVMPHCRRGSLQGRIARLGALEVDEVLRVGVKVAGALKAAHGLGIVHRDVKPANILLTDYGEPALTDFGISRVSGAFKTTTGVFSGSPAFTAPEILAGHAPSAASDVYGLGATLFAALTGHAAFERREGEQVVAQFVRIAQQPVPDLRHRGVPADVAAVVASAMAREPADRPSAEALSAALRRLQADRSLAVDEMAPRGYQPADQAVPPALATGSGHGGTTGWLPAPLNGFVGRRPELAQLRALVAASRLVTLTGVGGVGKTTLALHAAHEAQTDFPDGVWLVELADLREGALLVEVVAAALGVRDQSAKALIEVLVDYLVGREALVVLDNCEHIIDDAAKLVDLLLQECPQLHILATSREVINADGESVLPLAPLSCPDPDEEPTLRTLAGYDAVQLFIQRARAAVPDFALSEHNSAAVAGICARLDGLPLAIELAVARLRAMSVDEIADGLSDRYSLLTHGRRGARPRQQTLACCVDWSYDLCTRTEQQLWGRLSVFAGSFDSHAARDVCGADLSGDHWLDEISALVDKSILIRTERDGVLRFRLLETLRHYGAARIDQTDEYLLLRRRHAQWYQQLLAKASTEAFGPRQVQWIERLNCEMPNLREALTFSLTADPASALQMTVDMRTIWVARGMFSEARRWLDLALNAAPREPTGQRIRALGEAALTDVNQGEPAAARSRLAEARRLLQVVDDPEARGKVDCADAYVALLDGEFERARECLQRALTASDDFETQAAAMLVSGWVAELMGDIDEAVRWFEKGLALAESRGETQHRARALAGVGTGRWLQGQPQRAQRMLQQGLQLSRVVNDPMTGAQLLEVLAWVAGSLHNSRRATVLMAAAAAVGRAIGVTMVAHMGGFHDECERCAREELDPQEFEAAWKQGDSLTFDEAVAVACNGTGS
ncbi:protein kinase [Mycobacterium simiae]|uniref:Protein kinase n=1 Tax=Mycobacterium simiae TaxID=1784 RepID=A0A5B1BPI3_MYCSI|nr:protein kinase [Mycobacterium simiae]KAA1250607.1 protein kinase [Mycobacterium simiae]